MCVDIIYFTVNSFFYKETSLAGLKVKGSFVTKNVTKSSPYTVLDSRYFNFLSAILLLELSLNLIISKEHLVQYF